MLLSAPVAFIGPDALDRMGRPSRTARSAMAGQRWCAAPMATVGQRWCADRFASTDGGTPDLRGSDWLSGPNGLKSGFRGLQATYPGSDPVAAVFWPNACLSGRRERLFVELRAGQAGMAGLGGGRHGERR
jgi:hypothetical protein